jgi:predicted ATPase
MRPYLDKITLRGFKTIRELKDFTPGRLTVLIGANGAGKSNFISFFRFLSWALAPPGGLQEHTAKLGGASALLHDGPEQTPVMEAQIRLVTDAGQNEYCFKLAHASGDTLIYTEEKYRFSSSRFETPARWTSLDAGHREARLINKAEQGEPTAKTIHSLLRKVVFHQFHNTSDTARIRQKWQVDEGRWLKEDAGNLAPFLFRLQSQQPRYYHRIVETVRLILPFFAEFEFHPEFDRLVLQWRERNSDLVFGAGQAADGMLRIMALVALLQQPEVDLPDVLILDEPELGLHPYAIEVVAGLLRAASKHVQVVLATQSVSLIDRFDPEDIVVVDRDDRKSRFRRLGADELSEWMEGYEGYTLSELWEKNVIGGRP